MYLIDYEPSHTHTHTHTHNQNSTSIQHHKNVQYYDRTVFRFATVLQSNTVLGIITFILRYDFISDTLRA